MRKVSIQRNTGFTLIETFVAISILSLSILATFTAVQSGLRSSSIAKDQISAFYLTQEAMEYIKNVRDENALASLANPSSVSWLRGLAELSSDPCYQGNVCDLDAFHPATQPSAFQRCGTTSGSCPNLRQDTVTGLYGYTAAWPVSYFKREIQIDPVALNSNEAKVTVTVTWTTRGLQKTLQISELLYNRE